LKSTLPFTWKPIRSYILTWRKHISIVSHISNPGHRMSKRTKISLPVSSVMFLPCLAAYQRVSRFLRSTSVSTLSITTSDSPSVRLVPLASSRSPSLGSLGVRRGPQDAMLRSEFFHRDWMRIGRLFLPSPIQNIEA
jgi:hypothetical protein